MALLNGGPGFSQKPFIQLLFQRGCERFPERRAAGSGLVGAAALAARRTAPRSDTDPRKRTATEPSRRFSTRTSPPRSPVEIDSGLIP